MTMTLTSTRVLCNDCADLVPADAVAVIAGEIVCDPCRLAAYVLCPVCASWTLTGDMVFSDTGHAVCEHCGGVS